MIPLYERLIKEAYQPAGDQSNNIMFFEADWGHTIDYKKVPGGKSGSPHHSLDAHTYCGGNAGCHWNNIANNKIRAAKMGLPLFMSEFGSCLND